MILKGKNPILGYTFRHYIVTAALRFSNYGPTNVGIRKKLAFRLLDLLKSVGNNTSEACHVHQSSVEFTLSIQLSLEKQEICASRNGQFSFLLKHAL